MALPKKRRSSVLPDAQKSNIAAEMSERLSSRAQRLAREAEQLRIEGEEDQAAQMDAEAADLQNESIEQAQRANTLHKRASRRATVEALVKAPFNAAGTYAKSHFDKFLQLSNPVNQLQGLWATMTPFTGAFGRERSRLMGNSRDTDVGMPFGKVAKAIEESNIILNSISRSQVRLIKAEEETTHRVKLTEGATRDVQQAVKDLADVLVARPVGDGPGAAPWPDFGSPQPSSPSGGGSFLGLPQQKPIALLPPPNKMTPLRLSGPPNASQFMKTQTDALLQLVDLNKKQLDEMKEGDDDARLREARARGDTESTARAGDRLENDSRQGEERRGGFGSLLSGIASAIGGFFTLRVLPIFSRIASVFAPLGRMLAPLGRLLGIGGAVAGAGGAAAVARGAVTAAAGGGAARAGGGMLARVATGGIARRVLGFLPGVGSVMSGMDAYNAAREGNWGGAALHGAAAVAGFIPGLGPLARLGIQAIASGAGHMTNTASAQTPADRRVQALERPQQRERDRPVPNIITTNHHHYGDRGSDDRTVIAQSGKSIIERSRGELFAYTA